MNVLIHEKEQSQIYIYFVLELSGLFTSDHDYVRVCTSLDLHGYRLSEFLKLLVLFNDIKLEEFKPSQGIHQGYSISSYLFLLAAGGISCLLKGKGQPSHLSCIRVAQSALLVSHMLFANDSLLFSKACGDEK